MNERKDLGAPQLSQAIEQQRNKLKALYEIKYPLLSENECALLENLDTFVNLICYNSASHTRETEKKAHKYILKILQGENISRNKDKLKKLKEKDRQNMPYRTTHMAGISAVTWGFSLLIAAAVVFALMGLPAGLAFFLPLLIFGVVSLGAGGGLIKKGMVDNDKLFIKAWEKSHIDGFIKSITPDVEAILQKANGLIYQQPKKIEDLPRIYSPPLSTSESYGGRAKKVPSDSPRLPRSRTNSPRHSRTGSPSQQSLSPVLPRIQMYSRPPTSSPQVPGESSQDSNPPAPQ